MREIGFDGVVNDVMSLREGFYLVILGCCVGLCDCDCCGLWHQVDSA